MNCLSSNAIHQLEQYSQMLNMEDFFITIPQTPHVTRVTRTPKWYLTAYLILKKPSYFNLKAQDNYKINIGDDIKLKVIWFRYMGCCTI